MISMGNSPAIIKDASESLKPVSGRGITVMQGWYDKDIKACHVTLWDLGETDDNFSDDDAEGVTLSVQVTIFSQGDEVELAREIKRLMNCPFPPALIFLKKKKPALQRLQSNSFMKMIH